MPNTTMPTDTTDLTGATMDLQMHINRVVAGLQVAENAKHQQSFGDTVPPFPADQWASKDRRKFIAIDCRHSGAFLVEKSTGEIYNYLR